MVWRWLSLAETESIDEMNMAIDGAILDSFVAGDCAPTVRTYRWHHKCVTIGRSQDLEEARGSYPSFDIYRRPTGGRAVVHGDDLIVTVVAGENALRDGSKNNGILSSYYRILQGVVDTLNSYDVSVSCGTERHGKDRIDCFASIGRCDLVCLSSGKKIVGSAQRRSRGAIVQQMSIRRDERYHINSPEFVERLKVCMADGLAVDSWDVALRALPSEYLRSGSLSDSEAKGAECGTKNSYV